MLSDQTLMKRDSDFLAQVVGEEDGRCYNVLILLPSCLLRLVPIRPHLLASRSIVYDSMSRSLTNTFWEESTFYRMHPQLQLYI
jgi:hypothetical protein